MEQLMRKKKFKLFLKNRLHKSCKVCNTKDGLSILALQQLERKVVQQFSIKDDFYTIKYINDILFNNMLEPLEAPNPEQNKSCLQTQSKNLQSLFGRQLTAIFKDYLIYDDIYEFIEQYHTDTSSKALIAKHAKSMNQIGIHKYGFKSVQQSDHPTQPSLVSQFYQVQQENIVNRPNYLLLTSEHQRIIGNNLRLKYLMKYEKRVQERNLQKKIMQKIEEN